MVLRFAYNAAYNAWWSLLKVLIDHLNALSSSDLDTN